eukprot:Gb_25626 [translate_table: standard]
MGSEGPPAVSIHITGFKKFHGVAENPTERIVSNLQKYLKKQGVQNESSIRSCSVLETAGDGGLNSLYRLLESALVPNIEPLSESNNGERIIWITVSGSRGFVVIVWEQSPVMDSHSICQSVLANSIPISHCRNTIIATVMQLRELGIFVPAILLESMQRKCYVGKQAPNVSSVLGSARHQLLAWEKELNVKRPQNTSISTYPGAWLVTSASANHLIFCWGFEGQHWLSLAAEQTQPVIQQYIFAYTLDLKMVTYDSTLAIMLITFDPHLAFPIMYLTALDVPSACYLITSQ